MQLKTWHKVVIFIVTPTVLLGAWAAYRKFVVKKPIFSNADGEENGALKTFVSPQLVKERNIEIVKPQ